jgi:hypothetical protein
VVESIRFRDYTVWLKWNKPKKCQESRLTRGNLVRSLIYEAGPMWHRKSEGEESEAGGGEGGVG